MVSELQSLSSFYGLAEGEGITQKYIKMLNFMQMFDNKTKVICLMVAKLVNFVLIGMYV